LAEVTIDGELDGLWELPRTELTAKSIELEQGIGYASLPKCRAALHEYAHIATLLL
jgi:hypothetical protein